MKSWPAADVPDLPGSGPEPMIWDTATGSLAIAAHGGTATLYACGITPYDATHIGHAATYVAWDLLVRAWRDAGKKVRYVQNVTDVDDPLLERANRDREDWRALADREIALFRSDMTALRVLPPVDYVGAVESIPLIETFNQKLAERGSLYEVDGDTYFSRAADPAFGSVSGLDGDAMLRLCAENGGDPARPGKKDQSIPWSGWRSGRVSRRGRRRSAGAGRAGTWSAPRSRRATSGTPSTSRLGAGT